MSDDNDSKPPRTRRFDPTDGKGVPWGIVVALLGLVGAGGGGAGTVLGTNALASELREFRAEVRGELSRLSSGMDKITIIEERLRKVEMEQAQARGARKD